MASDAAGWANVGHCPASDIMFFYIVLYFSIVTFYVDLVFLLQPIAIIVNLLFQLLHKVVC